MVRALGALERGALQLTPQTAEGVTYAAKIAKGETRIDWTKPWKAVHDHCRGLSPFPGAWFELPGSQPARIKVLREVDVENRPEGTIGLFTVGFPLGAPAAPQTQGVVAAKY